jgi:hypothetical protein
MIDMPRPIEEITRQDCDAFRADPSRNPLSNRPIQPDGDTAQRLRTVCDQRFPIVEAPEAAAPAQPRNRRSRPISQLTQQDCDSIRQNPALNPLTNNPIDPHGRTSRQIRRECDGRYPTQQATPAGVQNTATDDNQRAAQLAQSLTPEMCVDIRRDPTKRGTIDAKVCSYLFPPSSIESDGTFVTISVQNAHNLLLGYRRIANQQRNTLFTQEQRTMMENLENAMIAQLPLSLVHHTSYVPPVEFIRQEIDSVVNNNRQINRYSPSRAFLQAIQQRFEQLYPLQAVVSPRNTPKHFSSRDVPSEEIAQTCKDVFQNVAPLFKSKVNKMKKMCNEYSNRCEVNRVKQVQSDIANVVYGAHNVLTVAPDKCLATAFKKNPDVFKSSFNSYGENMQIRFTGQAGVGQGVARTFVQSCIDDIKNVPGQPPKFFVPLYPGSERYAINPAMTPAFARELGYSNVRTEEDLNRLYTMIGTLFAFCARFDFPMPMYLARSVTARILHKEADITPEMSVFYHLMDSDPEVMNSILDLMKNPQNIEYVGLYMNDAAGNEVEVTQDNYFEYLVKEARTKYTHKLYENSPDTYDRLVAFLNGIYITRKLRENRVTVREFEKMLCGVPITMATIREWVQANRVRCIANSDREREIYTMFQSIITEMDGKVPLDEFGATIGLSPEENSRSRSRKLKGKAYVEFFMRLMQFWTGYRKIDMDAILQVTFERNRGMPTSHTCFRQLCLPRDIRDKDDLYERLVKAVSYVERGIGMY